MLTPLLVLCMTFSFGQEKMISGNVTDQDGLPLPGVSIVVVGTNTGTQSDFDGNYTIKANVGQVLRFSYLGQKTVNRTVGSSSTISLTMEEDAEALQEVVVQGYRTATKEKSSIAAVTISAETIADRPNANFINTLSGQVAGLNIFAGSGQPGANTNVLLRGVTSVNGNNEPLFVIDGNPVDSENFRSLNPQEIASVSVLKDAGATAIYGNRGANGVIIIKTRQGGFNEGLKINYTGIIGVSSTQGQEYDLMDSQEQLRLERDQGAGLGASLTDAEIAAFGTTDWLDVFFRNALSQNHTLTMSSGSENLRSFVSVGFLDQEGILIESGLKRFNFRSNINGKSKNDKFNYGFNLSVNYSESEEPAAIGTGGINRNFVLGGLQSVPYLSPADYTNGEDLLSPLLFSNTPLFLLDLAATHDRNEDELKLLSTFNASYKITDWLTANLQMSADYQDEVLTRAEQSNSFNALLFGGAANPNAGFQQQQFSRQFTYNQVTSLNFNKSYNKHTIDFGAYTEYFRGFWKTFGFTANGLNQATFSLGDGSSFIADSTADDLFVDNINANILEAGLFSYFGQLDYDYDTRYGLTGTVRRDASFRFSDSNRWATFYSVSGRWNISNESFMENSPFNLLKLRGSYGTAGNQFIDLTNDAPGFIFDAPDLTRDLFGTGAGYAGANSLFLTQIGNTTLKWETVTSSNIGLDFEVFESRLRGSVDVYQRNTTDVFQDNPISAINAATTLRANTGEIENRGLDASLSYDLINNTKNGLRLTLNVVGNYNETEVIDVPTEDGQVINGLIRLNEGSVINEYFAYRYAGVNPANGNLLFLDADGDVTENPNVDTDRVGLGKNILPDWQGSFGFNLDYKGFFITTQFNYATGIDRYDFDLSGFQNPNNVGQFRTSRDLFRAWTPDNRITDIPALNAQNFALGGASDRYLREADYVRLRFINVGYTVPQRFLEGTGFSKLRFFGNAENLFTFSKWRGLDPEVLPDINNPTQSRLFPSPKFVSFGVEVGF